jgi:hypothetical protein
VLDESTVDRFLWQGWYGTGDGGDGVAALVGCLRPLLLDAERRRTLGAFGYELVHVRFSLDAAAHRQISIYESMLGPARPGAPELKETAASAVGVFGHKARRKYHRWRGSASTDDFNAHPLATAPPVGGDLSGRTPHR